MGMPTSLADQICDEDMNTQKTKLDEAFMEWKGTGSQIDDILVIGIKI